ncbi:MAG TPA: septation protein SepH, partial [Actinomycetota bacterium]|nr:septation protein SepH [Actinomycetota bacterium]
WMHARETRVEIPERSNLTPAEIQALIRSGRGVRAVARLAGTPLAWIRYLAEPIRQERQGVVDQLLRARQTRARLGPSSETIGESVYQNLRSKGIRSPDRILEDGFTAHRSDDREWRVRLFFEHRGKRYSARWRFDPQTREVTPQNTLAVQLGWRRPRGAEDDGEPVRRRPAPRPRRASSPQPRKRATTRKRTAAARKRTTRSSSTARRKTATSRKTSARR